MPWSASTHGCALLREGGCRGCVQATERPESWEIISVYIKVEDGMTQPDTMYLLKDKHRPQIKPESVPQGSHQPHGATKHLKGDKCN